MFDFCDRGWTFTFRPAGEENDPISIIVGISDGERIEEIEALNWWQALLFVTDVCLQRDSKRNLPLQRIRQSDCETRNWPSGEIHRKPGSDEHNWFAGVTYRVGGLLVVLAMDKRLETTYPYEVKVVDMDKETHGTYLLRFPLSTAHDMLSTFAAIMDGIKRKAIVR